MKSSLSIQERIDFTKAIQNDEAAAADYTAIVKICTKVAIAGHGTRKMLNDCKPYLVALHRSGINPTHAVIVAKETAIIRALNARHGK